MAEISDEAVEAFFDAYGAGNVDAVRAGLRNWTREAAAIRAGLAAVQPLIAAIEDTRLRKALQVCEYVVHRARPTDAEYHAAQQASGAYATDDWQPEQVWDDLPDAFRYVEEVDRG